MTEPRGPWVPSIRELRGLEPCQKPPRVFVVATNHDSFSVGLVAREWCEGSHQTVIKELEQRLMRIFSGQPEGWLIEALEAFLRDCISSGDVVETHNGWEWRGPK